MSKFGVAERTAQPFIAALGAVIAAVAVSFIVFVDAATPAMAQDWLVYGARQQAMGSAGTASAEGSDAVVWNPAHYGLPIGRDSEWIGAFAPVAMDFGFTASFAANARGQFLPIGDAGWRTVNFIRRTPRFNDLALWLAVPSSTMHVDLKQEVTAAAALVAQLAALRDSHHAMLIDTAIGLDAQIGNVGFRFGSTSISGVVPVIFLEGLGLTGETPEALADGFARNFGTGGNFQFMPAANALSLSAGGQLLAQQLREARFQLTNITSTGGYNRGDVLAWWFDVSAKESGLDLDSPEMRNAIVQIITNIGGDNPFQSGQSPLATNPSAARLRRLQIFEFSVGFGDALIDQPDWQVLIGANLRGMIGRTRITDFFLRDPDASRDQLLEAVIGVTDLSSGPGHAKQFQVTLDLGMTIVMAERRLRLSVVGRNVPQPRFAFADGESFRLPAQIRIGVAAAIVPGYLVAAADIDMVKQTSITYRGFGARFYGFGVEVAPFGPDNADVQLFLRAGLRGNFTAGRELLVTAGIGLRVFWFQIDIAGSAMVHTINTRIPPDQFDWLRGTSPLGVGTIPQAGTVGVTLSAVIDW